MRRTACRLLVLFAFAALAPGLPLDGRRPLPVADASQRLENGSTPAPVASPRARGLSRFVVAPVGLGDLADAEASAEGENPVCGDRLRIEVGRTGTAT
ncbi:MAG: hypothetical protein R3F30_05530 [Planctomycetota bacterium]